MSNLNNTFLFSCNTTFIEEMYQQYLQNPDSVEKDWVIFFESLARNVADQQVQYPSWYKNHSKVVGVNADTGLTEAAPEAVVATGNTTESTARDRDVAAVSSIISAYRLYGHYEIQYDPLKLSKPHICTSMHHESYGLTTQDLDKEIDMGGELGLNIVSIKDVIVKLASTYSSRVGFEFMHVENERSRMWLKDYIEKNASNICISDTDKLRALKLLVEVEGFEHYAHVKFPGTKRFSVEGGESSLIALIEVIESSVRHSVREVVIGMAHRGRLSVLTNIMGKPYHAMFSEFKGEFAFPATMDIPGDVKYHLGHSSNREICGNDVHLSLIPNPSHLEVVNSVVLGKVRAIQDIISDVKRDKVLGILIHGDAAFSGQGPVAESLYLSNLSGYHTGGTIHIVINNQIGFTTNYKDSRSSMYCTDVAKAIGAPILHVNGDDIEAVIFAARMAADYRALYKKDVILDIVCYRKYGHNEGDEPLFTQPIMYAEIATRTTPDKAYEQKLIDSGVISVEAVLSMRNDFKKMLDEQFELSKSYVASKADWLEGRWNGMVAPNSASANAQTGMDLDIISDIGRKISTVPQDFNINPKLAKLLETRMAMSNGEIEIDWGMGEALAFGTLLYEGTPIRISGQDAKRGTFSHRHAVLFDQRTEAEYTPLNTIRTDQSAFLEVINSNLSEFGVMAFEYGYSIADPRALNIWEAQFGDFANGAQVVIDQYISSAEAKWLRMSGLVLLLPHGYEGNGPEHSSARLERFLQLCARDNIQVANCTTPASLFHILRRQIHRSFRKPLVVMTPKSLLRHKHAVSKLSDFGPNSSFKPVLDDATITVNANSVTKVILSTGKVYYDLLDERTKRGLTNVALVRLEQIYPFPTSEILDILKKYSNAKIVWCQEEQENMGAYYFVERRIRQMLSEIHDNRQLSYAGRDESPSPAAGYMKLHNAELALFMNKAFN